MTSLSETSLLAGASGQSTGYKINQSIRFNDDDNPYMERTHGTGGNVDKWTVSFWMKRGNLGIEIGIFGSGANNSNTTDIQFKTDDTLTFWQYIGSYQTRLVTTQKFRDTSAWYHVVVIYDSGNVVSNERARMYINGERVTDFGTETYPSQNQDGIAGSNVKIGFGRYISNSNRSFDGYLADMHYINGYAYGPEYFGEFTEENIWIPKEYSESYGTGGFKVDGRDSSDLGDDESGQGNDLTTSGLAAHDQVLDSPTNNFNNFNLNFLNSAAQVSRNATFKNGNLELFSSSTTADFVSNTFFPQASFKGYAEFYVTHSGSGIFGSSADNRIMLLDDNSMTSSTTWYSIYYSNGNIATSGESTISATAWAKGDVIGVAVDMANNIKWYRNGSLEGTADVGGSYQSLGYMFNIRIKQDSSKNPTIIGNYGQEGTFAGNISAGGNSDSGGVGNFKYSVPSGYLSLCTKNLGS